MKKKAIGLVLTAAVALGTVAFAEEAKLDSNLIAAPAEITQSYSALMQGSLTISETGEGFIIGKNEEGREIRLNISEETILIDSGSALPFDLEQLKAGDSIYAEYSSVMTRSIPPQSSATMLATNIENGGGLSVINVNKAETDADGNLSVYDNEKDIVLTIGKDAAVSPFRTKNIVKLADITAGTRLVAWYDVVSLSIPAQAYTEKVVAVSLPETEADSAFKLIVDDKAIEISDAPYYVGNTLMVPLRKIGEALGYNVGWDEASGAITIESADTNKATLFNGIREVIFAGGNAEKKIENTADTVINNGCTFVPLNFFNEFSNNTSVSGMTIKVEPAAANN